MQLRSQNVKWEDKKLWGEAGEEDDLEKIADVIQHISVKKKKNIYIYPVNLVLK